LADISWRVPFLLYFFSILILPFSLLYIKEPIKILEVNKKTQSIKSPKIIWFVFINVMLMWILFFIIPIQIPFYLKSIGIEKNALIGLAIASSTFFSAIGAISFSKIKDKLGFKQIFGIGYLLMAIAFTCIAYGNSYEMVMLAMLLGGLGMGIMIPNANVWVMQLAPQEIRGREIGRLTTFWFMGQFLSPIILLPFLDSFSQSQLFLMLAFVLLGLSIVMFGYYFLFNKKEFLNEL
jgi:MFS family permease